jgi:hypothetical protein
MRWAAAIVLVCLLMLATVASAPAQRADEDCSWGASSVMVEVVDGQAVETAPPATSGCIPG